VTEGRCWIFEKAPKPHYLA